MDQEKALKLPTHKECEEIWNRYATPLHVREHMRQVNRVGVTLARQLIRTGEHVTLDLVDRATLLHDTLRVTDWDTLSFELFPYTPSEEEIVVWKKQREEYSSHISHSEVNYTIFQDAYPEMARLIRIHSIGSVTELETWEEKLVNYADRRVAHDRIVSTQERLDEAYARYTKTSKEPLEHNPRVVQAIYDIENEIFSRIGCAPDTLLALVQEE